MTCLPWKGSFYTGTSHGVTATTPGITSLLYRREQMLGAATLPGASIRLLYECATDCLRRLPVPVYSPWDSRPLHARLLRHGPSQRAAETQALLPPGVLVQKTVSVSLGERLLLCTGVGTRSLTRWQLRDMAAALALAVSDPQAVYDQFLRPHVSEGLRHATGDGLALPAS